MCGSCVLGGKEKRSLHLFSSHLICFSLRAVQQQNTKHRAPNAKIPLSVLSPRESKRTTRRKDTKAQKRREEKRMASSSPNILVRVLIRYSNLLEQRPYPTQIATATCLWTVGDFISQTLEGRHKTTEGYDLHRIARMATFGMFCAGPIYCWWYKTLDRMTLKYFEKSVTKGIAIKIAWDQLVFEPPFMTLFFTATTTLENFGPFRSPLPPSDPSEDSLSLVHKIARKVKNEIVSTYLVDCCVWPAVQVSLPLIFPSLVLPFFLIFPSLVFRSFSF